MTSARDPLLLAAAGLFLLAAVVGGVEAGSWVGRPFPGFLVLENRVIASAGLARWPATRGGAIYQHEVVAVDGQALADARALARQVASLPPGTPLEYRLRRGGLERVERVATRVFDGVDFLLLFGAYLVCGIALCATALVIRYLRGPDRLATGTALGLWIVGMYALTATDLYGPYRLFRLHVLLECLLFAGTLHIALVFPHPSRFVQRNPRAIGAAYGAGAVLAALAQVGLFDPTLYAAIHQLAMAAFGAAAGALIASQLWAYLRPPSFEARQRVKVLALGTFAALGPQVALTALGVASGGQAPENTLGWSGAVFPLAIGYAVLRHDLLGVDAILRRGVSYALLSLFVGAAYAGAVASFEAAFRDSSLWTHGVFVALFAAVSVLVLLPLRDRLQSSVDRLFFRSAYDFRRLVETTSGRLASVADLGVIARELEAAVGESLHPEWHALLVRRRPDGPLEAVGAAPPPAPAAEAAQRAEREVRPFELVDGALAVPFRAEERLNGLLLLGRRLSGRYYGGDDRRLLHVLANQGAVAIENALALEQVRELNRDLERKVEERTSKLAQALRELRDAQAQLVHQEKMASLGQLVAGIAHEINNPLNFIQGNLHFLREHLAALVHAFEAYERAVAEAAPDLKDRLAEARRENDLDYVLGDLDSLLAGCDEGVERTTTLVRDLRTFSRVDVAERSSIDLHEAFDSTLTLLRGRLKEVHVVKDYGEIPPLECLASQINQVLMNLLANAADAVSEHGTITVRTRRSGSQRVLIEVEDDGCGIPPENLDRVFEPFFTTKDVGRGTGLGLAITYGVVARHGGEIRLRSEPGRGTCFTVELPVAFSPPPAEDLPEAAKPAGTPGR